MQAVLISKLVSKEWVQRIKTIDKHQKKLLSNIVNAFSIQVEETGA